MKLDLLRLFILKYLPISSTSISHNKYVVKCNKYVVNTYLQDSKIMMNQQRQNQTWDQQKLNSECIVIVVVSRPEFYINQINSCTGSNYEHQFHNSIICGHIGSQQIQIARRVNYSEKYLWLSGNSWKKKQNKCKEDFIAFVGSINWWT